MAYYAPFYQPTYYNPASTRQDMQYNQQFQQQMPQTVPQPIVQQMPQVSGSQQTGNGLIWVQGEAGAKSYLVAPGNTVMLMDSEGERFYLKSADASGMPMPLRIFDYKERANTSEIDSKPPINDFSVLDDKYITREEFERKIASIACGCKCKEHAHTKMMEEEKDDEKPFV